MRPHVHKKLTAERLQVQASVYSYKQLRPPTAKVFYKFRAPSALPSPEQMQNMTLNQLQKVRVGQNDENDILAALELCCSDWTVTTRYLMVQLRAAAAVSSGDVTAAISPFADDIRPSVSLQNSRLRG